MTDYTDEIKNRLNAYIHWKQKVGESIEDSHAPDIANLLAEREVLREALEFYASKEAYEAPYDDLGKGLPIFEDDNEGDLARKALSWKPEKDI